MLSIIGIGSSFGADRVGLDIINSLRDETELLQSIPTPCHLLAMDRPGASLINEISGQHHVIIIDAVVDQSQSDLLLWFDLSTIEQLISLSHLSSHGFGLADSLMLAQTLNQLPEKLGIIGINIAGRQTRSFSHDETRQLSQQIIESINHKYPF